VGLRAGAVLTFAAVREGLKQVVRRFSRTPLGKQFVYASVLDDPAELRFANVGQWPPSVDGFEDLAFLFSSNQLNHGIASLQFDEAALLYRLARDAQSGPFAEIGRFKGGSTMVFATALPEGAELWSYDLHVAPRPDLPGERLDRELNDALVRYGLAGKVHLIVGDSRTVEPPPAPLELLFIDGDHTYEGARADFERWGAFVRPGGHLLFHDAVDTGKYGNTYPGIVKLVAEIKPDETWERQQGAGSIARFLKRP
jgi:predicted O-methyltransferase YrrM